MLIEICYALSAKLHGLPPQIQASWPRLVIVISAGLTLPLYEIGQDRIISLIHSDVVEE